MTKDILVYVLLVISLLGLALSIKANLDLRSLYCDLNKSVFAEREYIYPILRKIDNPDNYGKDVENPLTTDVKYYIYCKK